MAEISEGDLSGKSSFKEIAGNKSLVYHGIGADLIALDGIATHGIASINKQHEIGGPINNNSPRDLAKNKDDFVSVAKAPESGKPNAAFMRYIENSPISFAVDSTKVSASQPSDRGYYDEAFIEAAAPADIAGIVLDASSVNSKFSDMSPFKGDTSPDVMAEKARTLMKYIGDTDDSLKAMLGGIAHITKERMQTNMGIMSTEDIERIKELDVSLRGKLAAGLARKFGDSDITVMQVVKKYFPQQKIYVNDHDAGIIPYSEAEYFETLNINDTIGYERYDGTESRPSAVKLRKNAPTFTRIDSSKPEPSI